MRINERQAKLLKLIEFNQNYSIPSLAKALNTRPHVIRYDLKKLIEGKVVWFGAAINTTAIHMMSVGVFFNLKAASAIDRRSLEQKLLKNKSISWAVEFSGAYQFGCTILTSNIHNTPNFLSFLNFSDKIQVIDKTISIASHFLAFIGVGKERKVISILNPVETTHKIDQTDFALLQALTHMEEPNFAKIARNLSVTPPTLHNRVANLRNKGIIPSLSYRMNDLAINKTMTLVFFEGRTSSDALRSRIIKFCKESPLVRYLTLCVGAWDFEIYVLHQDSFELQNFLGLLYSMFDSEIESVRFMTMLREYKNISFPFETFGQFQATT